VRCIHCLGSCVYLWEGKGCTGKHVKSFLYSQAGNKITDITPKSYQLCGDYLTRSANIYTKKNYGGSYTKISTLIDTTPVLVYNCKMDLPTYLITRSEYYNLRPWERELLSNPGSICQKSRIRRSTSLRVLFHCMRLCTTNAY